MLTQAQANRLISEFKQATSNSVFVWEIQQRQDELFAAKSDQKLQFVVTLSRNPFEIKIHARSKDRNIPLMRVDNAPFHANPDGSELRNTPHIHIYREGHELAWATAIDWYNLSNPVGTLERFLKEFNGCFPSGVTLAMI